jgi:hypothetical protein
MVIQEARLFDIADAFRRRGTLVQQPRAVLQTFIYLAYFIHLRKYADKVVAKAWTFSYCFDQVDTSATPFGEGLAVTEVKKEAECCKPAAV